MMNQDFKQECDYKKAKERVENIKGFYWNLATYILLIPVIVFVNLEFTPDFHWFWYILSAWGVGLASNAFQTFNLFKFFAGKDWEKRKIKEFMNDDKL